MSDKFNLPQSSPILSAQFPQSHRPREYIPCTQPKTENKNPDVGLNTLKF